MAGRGNPHRESLEHYHQDGRGVWRACYHRCRVSGKEWAIGLFFWTASFPFEHLLWDKVPPFSYLTKWMGI